MMRRLLPILIPFLLFLSSCSGRNGNPPIAGEKIKGVSFVAPANAIDTSAFQPLVQIGTEWIALMPYGFVPAGKTEIVYDSGTQWWGEKSEGLDSMIRLARLLDLKIMVKPQLWVGHGEFTGTLEFGSDAEWNSFAESYLRFILHFSQIAAKNKVELFCIGTELASFVRNRPDHWKKLIDRVRSVYKGKMTYAENWDQFENFPHWEKLDFIGVNGYFPLSEKKTPGATELNKKWEDHLYSLENCASKFQKTILFTEFGYRSIDYCTDKPWEHSKTGNRNTLAQRNAYQSFFESVWTKSWFAGVFLWKCFPLGHLEKGTGTDYTVHGKESEELIREQFMNKK